MDTCAYCGSGLSLTPTCTQCGAPRTLAVTQPARLWGWNDPDSEAKYEAIMARYVMAWKNNLPLSEFNYFQTFRRETA